MDEELDIVGNWTKIKLNILEEYAKAYARILSNQGVIKRYDYIDAFAGAGAVVSKATGEVLPGSSALALEIKPRFSHYHLIEMDKLRAGRLRDLSSGRKDVTVYEGDCNSILISDVFPKCRYEDYRRALCILDPYELNPEWEVVETAGHLGSIEIFLNFMIMDANRNMLLINPEAAKPDQIARMDRFWGDDSWRSAAYESCRGLFGDMIEKKTNDAVIQAYKKRLKEKAGFDYVPDPIPMKNIRGAAVYYLFFASNNKTGYKIAKAIFKKYRQ
jgi:three-Cys-motif partner protein